MANRDSGHEPETIIATGVQVEGDFVSQGNVLIEGSVNGSLRTEQDLHVGETAQISADVHACNATIAGEVKGNITVTGKLELDPTAHVYGDVRTDILVVAGGAVINGKIVMGEDAVEGKAAKKSSKKAAKQEVAAEEFDEIHANSEEEEEKTVNAFFR